MKKTFVLGMHAQNTKKLDLLANGLLSVVLLLRLGSSTSCRLTPESSVAQAVLPKLENPFGLGTFWIDSKIFQNHILEIIL